MRITRTMTEDIPGAALEWADGPYGMEVYLDGERLYSDFPTLEWEADGFLRPSERDLAGRVVSVPFGRYALALLFGWGRNGEQGGSSGGSGGGDSMAAYIPYLASAVNTNGAVTRADLCSEFAFNDLNRAVEGLNSGLCNGFYTTSTQMANGFAGVDNAICSLGYNNAQLANGINTTIMQGFNASRLFRARTPSRPSLPSAAARTVRARRRSATTWRPTPALCRTR